MTIDSRDDAKGRMSYRARVKVKDPERGTWDAVCSAWSRSRAKAERDERNMLTRRDAGALAAARGITVGQYLFGEWLPSVRRISKRGRRLAPTTEERYVSYVERISPLIGDVPLQELRTVHVERLRDRLLASGLAPQTVADHLRLLSQGL